MEQFIVPQFIDVENKIIGPISSRQFIIILADGLLVFICYKIFTFWAFIVAAVLLLGIGAVIAFVKVNGQAFHYFALNIIQTVKRPSLRIWHKEEWSEKIKGEVTAGVKILPSKKLVSSSRLAELALIADTGGLYRDTNQEEINKKI